MVKTIFYWGRKCSGPKEKSIDIDPIQVAVLKTSIYFLNFDGQLYKTDDSFNEMNKVNGFDKKIIKIDSGDNYLYCLCEDGKLCSTDGNSKPTTVMSNVQDFHFTCGDTFVFHKKQKINQFSVKQELKEIKDDDLKLISSQLHRSEKYFIYENGELFNKGANFTSVYTGESLFIEKTKAKILEISNAKKIKIFGNRNRSSSDIYIVLTERGELFSWGDNESNQLGLGKNIQKKFIPTIIDSFFKRRILDFDINNYFCVAIAERKIGFSKFLNNEFLSDLKIQYGEKYDNFIFVHKILLFARFPVFLCLLLSNQIDIFLKDFSEEFKVQIDSKNDMIYFPLNYDLLYLFMKNIYTDEISKIEDNFYYLKFLKKLKKLSKKYEKYFNDKYTTETIKIVSKILKVEKEEEEESLIETDEIKGTISNIQRIIDIVSSGKSLIQSSFSKYSKFIRFK
eukprot:gene1456-12075_t